MATRSNARRPAKPDHNRLTIPGPRSSKTTARENRLVPGSGSRGRGHASVADHVHDRHRTTNFFVRRNFLHRDFPRATLFGITGSLLIRGRPHPADLWYAHPAGDL